ncbi:MAG: hypothetical protein OXF84_06585 [Bacteroidetes bacterium]|nr:hypothetical protein [Bacteroidota bacterium]
MLTPTSNHTPSDAGDLVMLRVGENYRNSFPSEENLHHPYHTKHGIKDLQCLCLCAVGKRGMSVEQVPNG